MFVHSSYTLYQIKLQGRVDLHRPSAWQVMKPHAFKNVSMHAYWSMLFNTYQLSLEPRGQTQGATGKCSNSLVALCHWLAAMAPVRTGPFTTGSALAALVLMPPSSVPGNDPAPTSETNIRIENLWHRATQWEQQSNAINTTKIAAKEHFAAVMPTRLSKERKSCGESVTIESAENSLHPTFCAVALPCEPSSRSLLDTVGEEQGSSYPGKTKLPYPSLSFFAL